MSDPASLSEFLCGFEPPRFNRIVVNDVDRFVSQIGPRVEYDNVPALFGIPVVADEAMPSGVVELRNGDEVVERIEIRGV